MVECKLNKAFLHYVPLFCHFFKVECAEGALEIWKIIKNLAKNEENPCSTCVQPISRINFWFQKSDFFRDPARLKYNPNRWVLDECNFFQTQNSENFWSYNISWSEKILIFPFYGWIKLQILNCSLLQWRKHNWQNFILSSQNIFWFFLLNEDERNRISLLWKGLLPSNSGSKFDGIVP